jgi:hypothetical protein
MSTVMLVDPVLVIATSAMSARSLSPARTSETTIS